MTARGSARQPSPRVVWIAFAALLVFFVIPSGLHPLTVPDEGRYAGIAREMLASGDWATPQLDGVPFLDKPPLFYWLEAASFAVFGVHVWSARLVPALLGLLGCLLVFVAGSRLYDRRTGLLAAVVLATNPYYFAASAYVNHDLAVALWISGALLCFAVADRAARTVRRRWLWAGYAAVGLALLTKGLIGLAFPIGIVGLWIVVTRRWHAIPKYGLPTGLAIVAMIAVPWYFAAQVRNADFFDYFIVTQHFRRFTGTGAFHQAYGPWFFFVLIAAGFLPWSPLVPAAAMRALTAFRRTREEGRTDLLMLVWALFIVVFFSIPRTKVAGYVLPALPPLALLVARYWEGFFGRGQGRLSRSVGVSGGTIALAALALGVGPWLVEAPAIAPGVRAALSLAAVPSLCAGTFAVYAARRGRVRAALAAHGVVGVALCITVAFAANAFVRTDVVRLAAELRPWIGDGDTLVHYREYFYDLPFYLDRRVPDVVVTDWSDPRIPQEDSWRRELWLGLRRRPEAGAWLVDADTLASACGPGKRCFVVAESGAVGEVGERIAVVPIATYGKLVLLGTPATGAGTPSGAKENR